MTNYPETINYQNKEGWTSLMIAAVNSNNTSTEETVKILLKHNANINLHDKDGCTALMYASKYSRSDSTEKTLKRLLKRTTNINEQDNYGLTALMLASKYSNTHSTENTVKSLLEYGADVNVQTKIGNTALSFAIYHSNNCTEGTYRMLIERMNNCDVEIFGKKLIKRIWELNLSNDIVELAIQKGAKLSDICDERLGNFIKDHYYL